MRFAFLVVPALVIAGLAVAQDDRRSALDPNAKVPAVEYRSAFEGYRPFTEAELANWRRSNDEVGAAGGHAGLLRGQGGSSESSGGRAGRMHEGRHGGHK